MSTIYFGLTVDSAIAFAKEQGQDNFVLEEDLIKAILQELADGNKVDIESNSSGALAHQRKVLNHYFRSKYVGEETDKPVIVAKAPTDHPDPVEIRDYQLPTMATFIWNHVWWEDKESGWKKVRSMENPVFKEEEGKMETPVLDNPIIELNVRATHHHLGKTALSAIVIEALNKAGVKGQLRCQDGDIAKFFLPREENDGGPKLDHDKLGQAVDHLNRLKVQVVLNDLNESALAPPGFYEGSRAMNQGGFKKSEMVMIGTKTGGKSKLDGTGDPVYQTAASLLSEVEERGTNPEYERAIAEMVCRQHEIPVELKEEVLNEIYRLSSTQ